MNPVQVRAPADLRWQRVALIGITAGPAGLLGFALAHGSLPLLPGLSVGAVMALAVALAILPLALRRFQTALGLFLAWLTVEDLVRKLAGNDIRVYFIKDLVYAVVLVGLAVLGPRVWKEATGSTRLWLYALVGWAVVMSIPTAFQDWRLPLAGLRLDFLYAPLVVAGYLLGRERRSLGRLLVALAALGGFACAVGLVQAALGPGFLAPDRPTPGLDHLVLVRGLPEWGPVYRPTGTFVDPGRFASMAGLALAVALAAIVMRARPTLVAACATLAAAAGVWVSGGRAALLVGACLVTLASVAIPFGMGRLRVARGVAATAVGLAALVLLASLFPGLFSTRLGWYRETLDPGSPGNEWAFRWTAYSGDTIRGIQTGGLIGQGTGTESLGKQYLVREETAVSRGLYQVEGGYASVAVEWGVVGLVLWTGWTVAWTRRQWLAVRASRGTPLAAAGIVLFGWMLAFLFFTFFAGFQTFQNYFANAYFWLLSGVIFALPASAGVRVSKHEPLDDIKDGRRRGG